MLPAMNKMFYGLPGIKEYYTYQGDKSLAQTYKQRTDNIVQVWQAQIKDLEQEKKRLMQNPKARGRRLSESEIKEIKLRTGRKITILTPSLIDERIEGLEKQIAEVNGTSEEKYQSSRSKALKKAGISLAKASSRYSFRGLWRSYSEYSGYFCNNSYRRACVCR